jgi:hypothetical protein
MLLDLFRRQADSEENRSRKLESEWQNVFFKNTCTPEILWILPQMTGKISRRPVVILVRSFLKYISLHCYYTVSWHINNTELTNHSGRKHDIHYWLPSPPSTNGGRAVRRHSSANILDGSHHYHPSLMSRVATQSQWAIMKLTKLVLIKTVLIRTNVR